VKLALAIMAVASIGGSAHAEPLWEAELRFGYGMALGAGGGMTTRRATPLTITALGSMAIEEQPPLSAFGGLVVETLNRSSVGATGGVRLAALDGKVRVAGGATYVFAPYTLWGATASVGACKRGKKGFGLCADAALTAFFAGTDLAEDRTVTQIQGTLGMVFDAL
jgi:hypothetical protein